MLEFDEVLDQRDQLQFDDCNEGFILHHLRDTILLLDECVTRSIDLHEDGKRQLELNMQAFNPRDETLPGELGAALCVADTDLG
jgi:hypothetical protein